jgi:hypothetical protein
MTCRLHYNLERDILVSEEVTTREGVTYIAKISYDLGWWKIFNAKRRNCIKQGQSKNKNVLRRSVRRELIKLGVELETEFSKKGFAITRAS